jgi:hypothetical protein
LIILAACNQVYGLDSTRPSDAAYFDAPADAPYACPPLGTPPQFSRVFEQTVIQSCTSYTVSTTGRALAVCRLDGQARIAEGAIGEPMTAAPGFDALGVVYDSPRLATTGGRAIVRVGGTHYLYTRAETSWVQGAAIAATPLQFVSGPTRVGRIIAVSSGIVRELADNGDGTFSQVGMQTFAALGLTNVGDQVHLTGDGLRLVMRGSVGTGTELLYSDRRDLASGFAPFVRMPEIAFLGHGYMTEDCARLYFSGLGNVFSTVPI